MPYNNIILHPNTSSHVLHIQLDRPKALNALNDELMKELCVVLKAADQDEQVHVVVLSGNEKAFAAGADIRSMVDKSRKEMQQKNPFAVWDEVATFRKPIIAAVSGFALGGGCELAMMCDMIVASDTAQFGQPEIKLGIIPGAGGTQRLIRAVGKARAMELTLTGDFIGAEEASRLGLVNRIFSEEKYLDEALKLATRMATLPSVAIKKAKESILNSYELPMKEGLRREREIFYALFDTADQKEGMKAFLEKRKPEFKGR